ncbi:ESAT-6 protein secretion system EspG family protein [Actinokineospora auranticolor]|uniref:ESAT-6 protein secretion system EspG family protein n=1 Tax=Actinokineospora auranticolor TaxID=155976 RepID=A0A2S6GX68_9PSEU|nr:ESAT-6 protein secretion system EspG family protein [Actinokineospora auranticolor]
MGLAVTALEFDVLVAHLGIEPVPLVLRVPSPGRTEGERAHLARQAWSGLTTRGLGGPYSLDPTLSRLLDLLRGPDRELDGRLWTDGPLRVLAAATGDDAVLVVKTEHWLTFHPADASGLARHALSVLPQRDPGPGQSVTLPTADFEAATTAPTFAEGLRTRGIRH